jgi:glycosyltransferase involved in cell wall biosynthesis
MNKINRVLWIHNFEPGKAKGGGWMYEQYNVIKNEVNIDLYYAYGLRNPLMIFFHYFKLLKVINNYSLIHAQYGSMVGFLAGLMPIPKLLSLKGSDWYKTHAVNFKHKLRVSLGLALTRLSLKYLFKEVIVMSKRMKNELTALYPDLNVEIIVDPIDLDKFFPNDQHIRSTKNILFATVSLESPVKRYALAKNAFDIVKMTLSDANWYVMSNIPHEKVNEFINQADVILMTSTHEGWPNVVKESLACNVPFVATDVSDLKEIASLVDNCFVVEAEPKLLADAVLKAISAGKSQDLRRFVEPFEINNSIVQYKKIYSRLIDFIN